MKYKLIAEPNKNYSPMQQILVNRGIATQDIERYIKYTDQIKYVCFSHIAV